MKKTNQILKSISLLFTLCFTLSAHARNTVRIDNVVHASSFIKSIGSKNTIIYGGIAGPLANCQPGLDSNTFCNNCTVEDIACNAFRIHPTLMLRIEFTVTANVSGQVFVGTNQNGILSELNCDSCSTSSGILKKGDSGFIEIPWSEICGVASSYADATCDWSPGEAGDDVTVYISIGDQNFADANTSKVDVRVISPMGDTGAGDINTIKSTDLSPSAGVFGFSTRAADKKVYIEDLMVRNTCPEEFKSARVFYSEDDGVNTYGELTYTHKLFKDLPFDSNCTPTGEWAIDGLENNKKYLFRISILDIAKNNVFLQDLSEISK